LTLRREHTAIFALTLAFAIGIACAPQRAGVGTTAGSPRVIVLGFDGLDYELTRRLMAEGRLPNFSRLASAGSFSPLRTSIPPQSPVAWSSLITGRDAGHHAIFDFVHRDPATMTPYLSTTRTEDPSWVVPLFKWHLPLAGGKVTLLRRGQPFWAALEERQVETSILRMPANFPPSGSATRELSGMGTPDILGTYGTFSYFTSDPALFRGQSVAGGAVYPVDIIDGVVDASLQGPDNPFLKEPTKLQAPFRIYLDGEVSAVRIEMGDAERILAVGDWSDWVPVAFELMPFQELRGIVRFYLKQVRPYLQLYVSPINLDPIDPAMPISTPPSYARDVARAVGRFYTQGIPEDTKSATSNILSLDEFLEQSRIAGRETVALYRHALSTSPSGLMFFYFGNVDQVSHMLWRSLDPDHPRYDAAHDAKYQNVIPDLYAELDAIVGETLERMTPDATLVVMSDHGFTSWRRSFHLNSWLRDNGYLTLVNPAAGPEVDPWSNIDWSRTRAYGLGLNGLYINVRGRERVGIVNSEDRGPLAEEIGTKLLSFLDPATAAPAVTVVHRPDVAFRGVDVAVAPDLIVGYAKGTRVSNESALGGAPKDVIVDNAELWSGDHCMDPAAVPGIFLTSRKLAAPVVSLEDVAPAVLDAFGVRGFPAP
jgi:predicted AlkP superfamily phosphohydrolase/phosphomutase